MAWPSTVESFLVALVGMIDTMMVGTLGAEAIAAVGLSTQPKFIGLCVFFSINIAVSAVVARRKGQNDKDGANRALQQALLITVLFTVLISVLFVLFTDPILRLAGTTAETHTMAADYLRIIMGCMCFQTLSMVINAAQRGVGNTRIAMRTNLISNGINIIFNYLLIGGKLGFPALGVRGAAIATVLGTIVACVMSFASVLHANGFVFLGFEKKLRFDKATLSALFKVGSSSFAEQIFLRIGFFTYALIVARLGTIAFAAHQVGMNIMSISFSFADGLSIAAVALVGQSLGQKRPDLAKLYGAICQRIGFFISALLAVVYFFFGTDIYRCFSDREDILGYGAIITNLISVIVLLQIAQVIYSGCLRGAGDTRYVAFVSLVSVAFIRPAAGYILCYTFGFGLIGAWAGLIFDQGMRLILTWIRFHKGKWINIQL